MKTLKLNISKLRKLSFGLLVTACILSFILFIALTAFLINYNNQSLLGWIFLTVPLAIISIISAIELGIEGKHGDVTDWILNKIIKRKLKKHNIKLDLIEKFFYSGEHRYFSSRKDGCILDGYILREISENTYEISSDPVSVFNNAFKASLSLKSHDFKFSEYRDGRLMLLDNHG